MLPDIGAILTGLAAMIPKVFYYLGMSILSVIDLFQLMFRKLAGLDTYIIDGEARSGDIIYDFLRAVLFDENSVLHTVFIGMLILGALLLFLSVIVAIIRNEYTTEKAENTKGKIVGKAIKSILFAGIVPVVVLFGIYLANIVLVAVDSATTYNVNYGTTLDISKLQSVKVQTQTFGRTNVQNTYITYTLFGLTERVGTTQTTFSGTIFKAAAHGANRIRTTAKNIDEENYGYLIVNGQVTNFGGLFSDPGSNVEKIATKIDVAFADNVIFAESIRQPLSFTSAYVAKATNYENSMGFDDIRGRTIDGANKFDVQLIWYYYDLWQFNFIVLFAAAILLGVVFCKIIFGLMKRIVEMIGLFLMLPPLVALMPLDGENAYKEWRKKFLAKALMAFGAVGGMNIIFLILPELSTIKFFTNDMLNGIVNTILMIIALLAVKDFIALVSGFVGGEDVQKAGDKLGGEIGSTVGKALTVGASVAGVGGAALKAGGKLLGKGAKFAWRTGVLNKFNPEKKKFFATRAKRRAMEGQHMADANAEAFELYANTDAGVAAGGAAINESVIEQFEKDFEKRPGMKVEKANDSKAYYAKMRSALYEKFEKEKSNVNTMIDDGKGTIFQAADFEKSRFNKMQAEAKVTRKELWDRDYGQTLRGKYRIGKGAGGDVLDWMGAAKGSVQYLGSQFAQPITHAFRNAQNEMYSMFSQDGFLQGLMGGKEHDTLKNVAYYIVGTSAAEHKKAADKAKEKANEEKNLLRQKDMIIKAISESKSK